MVLENVIEVRPADPDSQWRLKPCRRCKGSNLAYERYATSGADAWRAKCYDCGFTVDGGHPVQHDAQLAWNQEEKPVPNTPWRNSGGDKTPCYGCPDRYTACSDHCRKPEYLAWKERKRKIARARMEEGRVNGCTADQIRKNRRVR